MINYVTIDTEFGAKRIGVETANLSDSQYFKLFPMLWEDTVDRFCRKHKINLKELKNKKNHE